MINTNDQNIENEVNADLQLSLWEDLAGNGTKGYDADKYPQYTFQVACANFNDYKSFDEAYELDRLKNNLAKINKFFYEESLGKLDVKFNIKTHNINTTFSKFMQNYLDDYDYGKDMYDKVMKNGKSISYTKKAQAYILIGSVPTEQYQYYNNGAMWVGKNFIISKSVECNVLAHEMLHVFGGSDLYSIRVLTDHDGTENISCVDHRDLSDSAYQESIEHEIFVNSFMKKRIGWFNESKYNDNKQTEIESVSAFGSYKINLHNNNGVNALKFGVKDKEYFLVETFREGIYVQRINTKYKNNFEAQHASELQVYAIRDASLNPFNYYFFRTEPIG